VGLAAPLLLACAGNEAPRAERYVLAGSAAQDLLVLPLNLTVTMPEELDAHSAVVWEELEIYLRDHGKQLKTAAFRDAHRLWLAGIQELRAGASASKAGFEDAARLLVGKLAEHAEFDTVIIPSLFVREAPILDRTARWDGVERTVEIEAIDMEAGKAASEVPLEGNAPAASIHAVVLDARGNKIQEAQGGLDLIVRVRALRDPNAGGGALTFRFAPRSEVFADRKHVREGIALALSPFVPVLLPQQE
jgi:hypothetical protein